MTIKRLLNFVIKKKISFLSSPFDLESLNLLFRLKIFNIKIASGEITHFIFLKNLAKKAKKIFISTGMSTLSEVSRAIKILIKNGAKRKNITVLHCHTDYPTQLRDVNLLAMKNMENKFSLDVGYSDHTVGNETAIAAVALGAKIIEKHITLSKRLSGPDHKASLEPDELKAMVQAIRNIEKALGDGIKRPSPSELKNKPVVRKSLVAATAIQAGEKFSTTNMTVKRPGTGISPMCWDDVLGRTSNRDFEPEELIEL